MEPDTGETPGSDQLHALNQPQPIRVRLDGRGLPASVWWRRRWTRVERLADVWRIDDEWWRPRPVSRLYVRAVVGAGRRLTLFCDLGDRSWWHQSY